MALSLVQTPPPSPAVHNWQITPADYGIVIGDNITVAEATHNCEAMQAAWDYCASSGRSFLHVGGPIEIGSELKTRSGLIYERKGASSWLKPRWTPGLDIPWLGVSKIGGFISNNLGSVAGAASIQENIRFIDPWIDGSAIPASDWEEIGQAQGGSATTITLALAANATDGWYVGKAIMLIQGTGSVSVGVRTITSYIGATRIATIGGGGWSGAAPDATSVYTVGINTNAINSGSGMTNLLILGGVLKNFRSGVPGASGGKGITSQQGSTGVIVNGTTFENCLYGIMKQGWTGTNPNGSLERNTQDTFTNLVFRNCGTAIAYYGNSDTVYPASMVSMSAVISNVEAYECGAFSMGQRNVGSAHQKAGVFNIAGGHNVSIRNVRIYNSVAPTYPTDYASRVWQGLTGPIGAVVWMNGARVDIDGLYVEGNYDALVHVNRVRALGDDGPTGGAPILNFKNSIRNAKLRGNVDYVLNSGETSVGLTVTDANLSLDIQVEIEGTIAVGLVRDRFAGYKNTRLDITKRDEVAGTYQRIEGTAGQIYAGGNTFASFRPGRTNLDEVYASYSPQYVGPTGRTFSTWAGPISNAAVALPDVIYFYPFQNTTTIDFLSGDMRVITGGAGSSVKAAIWANSPTTNRPVGAPLFSANAGAATTTTPSDVSLVMAGRLFPGIVWVGTKFTGTLPVMLCIADDHLYMSSMVGSASLAIFAVSLADPYANAMPTIAAGQAFTNLSGNQGIPILGLKI